MFASVLIANRGEIACRVARTARRLGLRTIAVYSQVDAGAPHVRLCDEAHPIGPAPARESYLAIDKLIELARATGAAMHPSRLRVPVRECRLRASLQRGRDRLRRSAPGGDPRHGIEGPCEGADAGGRRAGRAGLSWRSAGRSVSCRPGGRDRLPGVDQGGGGRRRQRHAPRRSAHRVWRCARERATRGSLRLRRQPRPDREIHRRPAPHRNPGVRRRAWQRHTSQRARLLAAAPAPEGDRGGAGARHDVRLARGHG